MSEDGSRIDFSIGQPSADLLPVSLFRRISDAFGARLDSASMNYGDYAGDPRFLEALANYLTESYGFAVAPGELFQTAGASQAIDLVCALFCRRGDVVLVEEPTYFLALEIFASHGLQVVPVATDDEGLRPEALASALDRHPQARLLYTIPVHHNPTSVTLSEARRQALLRLTRAAGVTILADEVYQLLHYDPVHPPPAPLAAEVGEGGVISVGSFSKILAPALRVGWIQSDRATLEHLAAYGMIRSGGAINQLGALMVNAALESGEQQRHLRELLIPALSARADAMASALKAHFDASGIRWHTVNGGYFFWLCLPPGTSATALQGAAAKEGVGFHPGRRFSSSAAGDAELRLSFAHYDETTIGEGIAGLARAFERLCS